MSHPTEPAGRATSGRGARTREHILDVAELLIGERGSDAVSLREIRIAAGQRNSSAIQFHFGDATGLLEALARRHMPRVGDLAGEIRSELIADGRGEDPAALVAVLVGSNARYLERGPSERAWVKIAAAESARPERLLREFEAYAPTVLVDVGIRILAHLRTFLADDPALARLTSIANMGLHLCAERARALDATGQRRRILDAPTFEADLLAMTSAALLAPLPPSHTQQEPRLHRDD